MSLTSRSVFRFNYFGNGLQPATMQREDTLHANWADIQLGLLCNGQIVPKSKNKSYKKILIAMIGIHIVATAFVFNW